MVGVRPGIEPGMFRSWAKRSSHWTISLSQCMKVCYNKQCYPRQNFRIVQPYKSWHFHGFYLLSKGSLTPKTWSNFIVTVTIHQVTSIHMVASDLLSDSPSWQFDDLMHKMLCKYIFSRMIIIAMPTILTVKYITWVVMFFYWNTGKRIAFLSHFTSHRVTAHAWINVGNMRYKSPSVINLSLTSLHRLKRNNY